MISSKMGPALPYVRSGDLTPTLERQAAFVGLTLGAGAVYARPGMAIRAYKFALPRYVAAVEMAKLGPGLKGDLGFGGGQQMGVRYGGTGEITTIGGAVPFTRMYGPAHTLPFPDFGFGLTSVPEGSSRFYYEAGKSGLTTKQTTEIIGEFKSRGGQARSLPSSVGSRKSGSIGSPSAQATRSPSRGRRGSRISGRRRRAPYCRRHKKYHWCNFTRKNK